MLRRQSKKNQPDQAEESDELLTSDLATKPQQVLFVHLSSISTEPLISVLEDRNCVVRAVDSAEAAIELIAQWPIEVVFVGLASDRKQAMRSILKFRSMRPLTCVAVGSLENDGQQFSRREVLEIIRAGADDFLEPPFQTEEVQSCLSFCRDKLSQRQQMHQTIEALRRSEEQFLEFAEHLDQAFWLSDDANQQCLYVSPAYERIFGLSIESLYENTYSYKPLVHPDDVSKVDKYIAERKRGNSAEVEYRFRHPDGSIRWIRSRAFPIVDENGSLLRIAGITEDTTEKKRLEEELLHTQKMQAIGELAGGIAHDFNNLLTPILGYSDLLTSGKLSQQKIEKASDTIRRAATRAMELTKQLLGFARKGKHQHLPVDVHSEVDEVVALVKRTFDKKVIIETRLEAGNSVVLGDPTQINQVLLNLALNARDAMSELESARLTITTAVSDVPYTLLVQDPNNRLNRYLKVTVSDTGCGIEHQTQQRIFEPFFSTKPHGEGSGMGLAMVYGIVRTHGGTIEVESEVGQGTTFRFYLPLADEVVTQERAEEGSKGVAESRTGVVLLVDDEESVREVAQDMLTHLGYEVLVASDGLEAIAIYKQRQNDISLVILDMLMPRLGGHDCYRKLREINSEVVAILSTGYDLNHSAQKILDEGVKGFIQKPYTLEQFAETTGRFHPSNK